MTQFRSAATLAASSPAKVILFGEHAINRGQPAISASAGLYVRCQVGVIDGQQYEFLSGGQKQSSSRQELIALVRRIERYRETKDYEAIRRLAAEDYFAPAKYVLYAAFKDTLPQGLEVCWVSEIPGSSGLGSGGAAFTALVAAVLPLLPQAPSLQDRASWAHLGDVIAHGGIASALDTQTALLGGVIWYTGEGLADAIPCARGLMLVLGDTGVSAATGEVNNQVRRWLAEQPSSRIRYFETIGALAQTARPLMEQGDWEQVGRLFTLNQLALEKIGVSSRVIERLVEAALGAGAYGAKLSGSGGGGIVIALTSKEKKQAVADAIAATGGTVLMPDIGVPGVSLLSDAASIADQDKANK